MSPGSSAIPPEKGRRGGVAAIVLALAAAFGAGQAVPAVAQVAPPAPVEATPLARDAFATGLLSRGDGALAPGLWRGARADTLAALLDLAPRRPASPAIGEAMRRVLLSAGDAPPGATSALGGRKLLALARAGFVEEARTIASLSSAPRGDPYVGQALAVADLLEGRPEEACRRNAGLSSGRDEIFWVKLRVLCYALAGERDAAELTFDILRERGAVEPADEPFFLALTTGAAPKTPPAPENALHLAALRQLALPLAPELLGRADAGVLRAVARDESADIATRAAAARMAAAMGVMSREALAAVYAAAPVDVAEVAQAADRARARPDDPMTDILLYQSVAQMNAPEFLRDKAARIALALDAANTFPRAYAASLLYAEDIRALEGALVAPSEAAAFALARMAAGDGEGAAGWLSAMLGTGGLAGLAEEQAMAFIDLASLLAALDPAAARRIADQAGVVLDDPMARARAARAGAPAHGEPETLARVLEAAFEAARADIPGQAGLAALAASRAASGGDPLAQVIVAQSLRAAGLEDLRRRLAFETAWKARFAAPAPAGETRTAAAEQDDGEEGLTPRLKPRKRP
ncbi:hypothetical protein FHS62_002543 [Amphiplicatus metriothermophilus]|uniref:hypothetical protein n=1 Tax=Amphiplicatus metriothermophilus TaxID=1519374 RepID=UPI001177F627|nr:hypothetical protein [Amphiplicatus metriothermophilus]MBB5519718.1 hypothetical protein [Amphiplicatus metriothermophilus]